ncbi:TetR/AcrR family transcriptional regulator [Myceligenerans crystallogenes]|uniref:TetR/AcrR family transcriptional regulator n=1 Tax=Myceligenerans crystallogenes TaxID=316335 RepID=A0ABN2NIS7_9MICO
MTTNTTTDAPALSGRHVEARRQAVDAARAIMIRSGGVTNVTIAAVAKALKFTSPALYRYFPGGRDELLRAVHHAALEDLAARMVTAREMQPRADVAAQLYALTHTVFCWSLAHPGEFSLLMGSDFHEIQEGSEESDREVATIVGGPYVPSFVTLMEQTDHSFWPAEHEVPAEMHPQIREHVKAIAPDLDIPLGLGYTWIRTWRAIFGVICMAAFGHLSFAFGDFRPMFDDMMAQALLMYGLEPSDAYVPAASAVAQV